ncbi:hypothetical protein Bca52824_077794 [Brassica carinata]|uniref:Reverse transcriptase zinc-binding domain-containing protein n=1 Tax=Brassica carinata TaxID=52824 RepID=A0A8X7PVN2_BRACI|nr:hypothetical protein Bca52824_077794 [Brassica carinata]
MYEKAIFKKRSLRNLVQKIKLFIRRCALNNLPTEENFRKRGLQGHTLCSRCGEEETLEHILFQCDMAVAVWELCPWSSSNLFPWICCGLWINRNLHTFENKQITPPEVISKAIALLREWETAQTSIAQLPSNPPAPQLPSQISSPSTIICNTEAAWCKETREAGLAWIFTFQT